jgi:hypothetical protein
LTSAISLIKFSIRTGRREDASLTLALATFGSPTPEGKREFHPGAARQGANKHTNDAMTCTRLVVNFFTLVNRKNK